MTWCSCSCQLSFTSSATPYTKLMYPSASSCWSLPLAPPSTHHSIWLAWQLSVTSPSASPSVMDRSVRSRKPTSWLVWSGLRVHSLSSRISSSFWQQSHCSFFTLDCFVPEIMCSEALTVWGKEMLHTMFVSPWSGSHSSTLTSGFCSLPRERLSTLQKPETLFSSTASRCCYVCSLTWDPCLNKVCSTYCQIRDWLYALHAMSLSRSYHGLLVQLCMDCETTPSGDM